MMSLMLSLRTFKENLLSLWRSANKRILLVLKNDAYGVGIGNLLPVLRELRDEGVLWGIALRDLSEALRYRDILKGFRLLSLITELDSHLLKEAALRGVEPVLHSLELIEMAPKVLPPDSKVHLKIETGMNRFGISWRDEEALWSAAKSLLPLKVESVMTHLIDGSDDSLTHSQLTRFWRAYEVLSEMLGYKPLSHAHSSSPLLWSLKRGDILRGVHLIRVGLIAYGISPELKLLDVRRELGLKTALSLKLKPITFREVSPGENVGYGANVRVPDGVSRIAVLPLGYEVIPRGLGRALRFRVSDGVERELRVVGELCMDCCFVSYPSALNTNVTLKALWDGEWERVAHEGGTVPHELLLRVASALRDYVVLSDLVASSQRS